MANFDSASRAKIVSITNASHMIRIVYSAYAQAKNAQGLIDLYTGGTDPVFVAAVNAMTTPAERSELGQVLTALSALVTDLETNHSQLISSG